MSATALPPPPATSEPAYEIVRMFHPSHRVPDLAEAERFFERVFGCGSTRLSSLGPGGPQDPDNRTDYSTFTVIRDVVFDTIDPRLYIKKGVQQYPTVTDGHLNGMGWHATGVTGLFHALRRAGFDIVDQLDTVVEGDEPPLVLGAGFPMFWTTPESAGLRYQFLPPIPFPGDPRNDPEWALPPVSESDPLRLDRCAWHTVLTADRARGVRLFAGVLGGALIHEGRDEALGADASYVALGDGVYQFATPDAGTAAHADWRRRAPLDTYHSLVFKTDDLDAVAAHLEAQGVGIAFRDERTVIADARLSIGVPWRFVTAYAPNDPRFASHDTAALSKEMHANE